MERDSVVELMFPRPQLPTESKFVKENDRTGRSLERAPITIALHNEPFDPANPPPSHP